MKTLVLPVKRIYFDQIRSGVKTEEYRSCNPYWLNRLENRHYDDLVITLGYPKRDDESRRMRFPYRGFTKTVITHEHFGNKPVTVLAIQLMKDKPNG